MSHAEQIVLAPEGTYMARLVDRRWGSDTYQIEDPGKPWHGQKVFVATVPVLVRLRVRHQVVGGSRVVGNWRVA